MRSSPSGLGDGVPFAHPYVLYFANGAAGSKSTFTFWANACAGISSVAAASVTAHTTRFIRTSSVLVMVSFASLGTGDSGQLCVFGSRNQPAKQRARDPGRSPTVPCANSHCFLKLIDIAG